MDQILVVALCQLLRSFHLVATISTYLPFLSPFFFHTFLSSSSSFRRSSTRFRPDFSSSISSVTLRTSSLLLSSASNALRFISVRACETVSACDRAISSMRVFNPSFSNDRERTEDSNFSRSSIAVPRRRVRESTSSPRLCKRRSMRRFSATASVEFRDSLSRSMRLRSSSERRLDSVSAHAADRMRDCFSADWSWRRSGAVLSCMSTLRASDLFMASCHLFLVSASSFLKVSSLLAASSASAFALSCTSPILSPASADVCAFNSSILRSASAEASSASLAAAAAPSSASLQSRCASVRLSVSSSSFFLQFLRFLRCGPALFCLDLQFFNLALQCLYAFSIGKSPILSLGSRCSLCIELLLNLPAPLCRATNGLFHGQLFASQCLAFLPESLYHSFVIGFC
mmetsp:Transcript_30612/g.70067  ORF Transcript_30612/g.70067 Transcript_30612/m.70067 type:complete len:401 (-) Transcript_30612:1249-2451(-)